MLRSALCDTHRERRTPVPSSPLQASALKGTEESPAALGRPLDPPQRQSTLTSKGFSAEWAIPSLPGKHEIQKPRGPVTFYHISLSCPTHFQRPSGLVGERRRCVLVLRILSRSRYRIREGQDR